MSTLSVGQELSAGEQLLSPGGTTSLSVQSDGNVAILLNEDPLWTTDTEINPGDACYLVLTGDANLQLLDRTTNATIWQSGTSQTPEPQNPQLVVQDNGTIQIVTGSNTVVWTCPSATDAATPGTTFNVVMADSQGIAVYEQTYAYDDSGSTDAAVSGKGRWKLTNERWIDESLKPAPTPPAKGAGPTGDTTQNVLAVAKFAWDFIKENTPVVTVASVSTSVLSEADSNPLHYQGAQNGSAGTFSFIGTIWPTNLTQWEVDINLAGQYAASPMASSEAPPGSYLPSVYTNVSQCNVYWPYSVNASASVSPPSNTGTTSVVAQVDVIATLNAKSFIDNFNVTVCFRANGTGGFTLLSIGA